MSRFKPLLAAKVEGDDFDKLTFPMIASPKIDGIRCLIIDGKPMSRSLKPIPNAHIQAALTEVAKSMPIEGFDGELVTYSDGKIDDFNTVQSKVMRVDGEPNFKFHVFDDFTDPDLPYHTRIKTLLASIMALPERVRAFIEYVPTVYVNAFEDVADLEHEFIDNQGWEGVMLRKPDSPYKYGRSTFGQGYLLKIKRFDDDEAVIKGFVERMHNSNKAFKDELGHTKRSSAQEGMVPTDTLGALIVDWNGQEFEIGTGFNDAQRKEYWENRDDLVGQSVTFKYQGVGSLGRPRFPVFLGFRRDI